MSVRHRWAPIRGATKFTMMMMMMMINMCVRWTLERVNYIDIWPWPLTFTATYKTDGSSQLVRFSDTVQCIWSCDSATLTLTFDFFHSERLSNVDTGLQNSVQMLTHALNGNTAHNSDWWSGRWTLSWHVHLYDVLLLLLIVTEFCQCDVVVIHQVAVRWCAVSAAWWALAEPRHHLCIVSEQQLQVDGNIDVLQCDCLHVVCHHPICAVLQSSSFK